MCPVHSGEPHIPEKEFSSAVEGRTEIDTEKLDS